MAMLTQEKLKEMEEEMDRFEQEILAPSDEPRMIIGANTYTKVQARLKMASHSEDYHEHSPPHVPNETHRQPPVPNMEIPLSVLSAPPPPPPPSGQRPLENQFTRLPPPPPPPQMPPMARPTTAFLPPQLRHRPPMPLRHPMHMAPRLPSNAGPMPHFQPPPPPPMMGGPGPGGPPPHHMPGPMMMPPQRPFMGGQPGPIFNHGQQIRPDPVMHPGINIEKPKVIYSAPPTSKNQKVEPPRIPEPHIVNIVGQPSSSVSVSSSAPTVTSVPSIVNQYQSSDQTHPVANECGTDEETVPMDSSNDPDASGQQKEKKKEKKKKYVRTAAGQIWDDHTLSEWITDDFRIFCGDLGNEVTDEVLTRAFSKFPSFVKAKVVRDKRSNKTKGYGFVSFRDPNDFVRAMREMNGKYVGNRPIKLRKSSWKERNIEIVRKKDKEKKRLGLR